MSLAKQIEEKLAAEFAPEHIEVQCESHLHNVPAGSEMHFRVVLVSEEFNQLRKVQRHQRVYGVLAEEMAGPIHALALHTFSPEEWQGQAPDSPQCLGGSKKS
ncbi:transcriptional regulator [Microbulbifer flavimaris]|uniref:Transcriptional regulator n=1 Tax=Microbulbifer flavimaris TaxID=1781068 RepID=A0ABX4HVG4_9GAMM|nr:MULTISPECIES: BolA/IbaG family iron-sulfur metabolism protein [Microbulbifer]KUJ79164.1 transcriptional regulator [Microbulbifer sp. ZGT114]PCO04087.1 transcriptional regulator [Microbulbifer flavimaris]